MNTRIVYEDDDLFAVDKPGGLLSVPGRTLCKADSLISRLQEERGEENVRLVHRLDRDTAGLILFGKHREAQRLLGLRFERRQVEKEYHAWVQGCVKKDAGVIDAPVKKDWTRNDPPVYMVHAELGRSAITRWCCTERSGDVSFLRLFPQTGRSHQLRVHCLHLGHPILGDPIYAPDTMAVAGFHREQDEASLCLRAVRLRFLHPMHSTPLEIVLA